MSVSLQALVDPAKHDNLLLAEVVGWLHDFWKCTDEHVEHAASSRAEYITRYIDLFGEYQVTILDEGPVSLKALINDYILSSIDRVYVGPTSGLWLSHTLRRCHHVAHTEKEEVFYHMDKQMALNRRSSSSFGYESRPLQGLSSRLYHIPFDKIGKLNQDENRSELRAALTHAFRNVPADTRRPINEVTLWDWSSLVAAFYKAALAQSILQNSKEDPASMAWRLLSVRLNGADFLERAARIPDLLVRQKLITDGLNRVRRLLEETCPLGTEVYRDENGSVFIVPSMDDLLTLKNAQGATLRDLIKQGFSSGTIFRKNREETSLQLDDEVVPWLEFDKKLWKREDSYRHQPPLPVATHVTATLASPADPEQLRQWWKSQREDTCTVCRLRPQGKGAVDYQEHYSRKAGRVPCPKNCQTCKALERRVCGICERRREDRAEEWATEKRDTTIWMDEVADSNGRVALVAGKFDLADWLDGKMLFYPSDKASMKVILRIKNLGADLTDGQQVSVAGNMYTWHQATRVLLSENEIDIRQVPKRFQNQDWLIDRPKGSPRGFRQEKISVKDIHRLPDGHYRIDLSSNISSVAVGTSFGIWGKRFKVTDNNAQIETDSDEAVKLVEDKMLYPGYFMVEKSFGLPDMIETQTPARLHRLWETTRRFWEEVVQGFSKSVGEVQPRLWIRVQKTVMGVNGTFEEGTIDNVLGKFHTYELKLSNVNLSIVYCGEGEFLTADNLERTAILLHPSQKPPDYAHAARDVFGKLVEENKKAGGIQLEQPTGYGNPNKPIGRLYLADEEPALEDALEQTLYTSAIPIFADPRTFMALVPANKALAVAQSLKSTYEKEMGKVRNRLPLALGLVFAERHAPLPALLDAGRRMLKQPAQSEDWTVKATKEVVDSTNPHLPEKLIVSLENEERSLSLEIRTVMGDGTPEDVWYPYWQLKLFQDGQSANWVHARYLHNDDVVAFTPSHFDFEFLTAAAQRFEVSYEGGKRRGTHHPRRPYYLEELEALEWLWQLLSDRQGLTLSQIHNLIGFIEAKREGWRVYQDRGVFEDLVHDALDNPDWKVHPRERLASRQLEQLCQAAVNGQLADVVELYVHILKRTPERDRMEELNNDDRSSG